MCLPCNIPVLLNHDSNVTEVEQMLSNVNIAGFNFTQICHMRQNSLIDQYNNYNLFTNRSIVDADETIICLNNVDQHSVIGHGEQSFNSSNEVCDIGINDNAFFENKRHLSHRM